MTKTERTAKLQRAFRPGFSGHVAQAMFVEDFSEAFRVRSGGEMGAFHRREGAAEVARGIAVRPSGGNRVPEDLAAVGRTTVRGLEGPRCSIRRITSSSCGALTSAMGLPRIQGKMSRSRRRSGAHEHLTRWGRAWRTIPAPPLRSCWPPAPTWQPSWPCGARWDRCRLQGACGHRPAGRGHPSGRHPGRRRGRGVFPCHRIGTSAATTCPPLGETSRYSPPPSNSRCGFSRGLAVRSAVSVSGTGAALFRAGELPQILHPPVPRAVNKSSRTSRNAN